METILVRQVLTMFLLILVGYLMFQKKKITLEGSKTLGNVLIYVSLPCVILKSFFVERTSGVLAGIGISAVAALLGLFCAMLISGIIFQKDGIASFAGAFSNPGFFGIPLIVAGINEKAVIYVACYIAILNLFQWSYGVMLLTKNKGENQIQLKELFIKLIKAPFMIAILLGIIVIISGCEVPVILQEGIGYLAGLNTPIAMFTVGVYLTQINWKEMIKKRRLYAIAAVRLIVIPLVVCLLLRVLFQNGEYDMKMAILIASACPVGSNIAVYAQLHDSNYVYAVETIVISTLLCMITIPFVVNIGVRII